MAITNVTWSVYIISCSDGSFYTGITTNVSRRFQQHRQGQGAKYFRSRQPSEIVFIESGHCRSSATQREITIKKNETERQAPFDCRASNPGRGAGKIRFLACSQLRRDRLRRNHQPGHLIRSFLAQCCGFHAVHAKPRVMQRLSDINFGMTVTAMLMQVKA